MEEQHRKIWFVEEQHRKIWFMEEEAGLISTSQDSKDSRGVTVREAGGLSKDGDISSRL